MWRTDSTPFLLIVRIESNEAATVRLGKTRREFDFFFHFLHSILLLICTRCPLELLSGAN